MSDRIRTLPHMLFQCNITSAFWIAFQQWWCCESTRRTFELNERNVIFDWYSDTQFRDVLNCVALVAKYLIFCCFQDNTAITFDRFPPFLSNKIETPRQIALKNKQLKEFNKKCKKLFYLFSVRLLHLLVKFIFLSSSFCFTNRCNLISTCTIHVIQTHFLYLSFKLYYYDYCFAVWMGVI